MNNGLKILGYQTQLSQTLQFRQKCNSGVNGSYHTRSLLIQWFITNLAFITLAKNKLRQDLAQFEVALF